MRASQSKTKRAPPEPPTPQARPVEPAVNQHAQQIAIQLFPQSVAPSGIIAASSSDPTDGTGNSKERSGAASVNGAPLSSAANSRQSPSSRSDSTGAAPFGVIVDDGLALAPGQMYRTQFMASLSAEIERVANEELAATGRTAQDCPYLIHWLRFYRERPAAHIERAIKQYSRPERLDPEGLREAVAARVRTAVQAWIRSSGREVAAPEGVAWLGQNDGLSQSSGKMAGAGSEIQRKPADAGTALLTGDPEAVRAQLQPGQSLDSGLRTRMERGFGSSFRDVRLHTDSHAARMAGSFSARAFTIGDDIAFAAGQYKPGTLSGDALLAHELAHTLQQRTGFTHGNAEREADSAALDVMAGSQAQVGGVGGLRLQRCSIEEINCQTIQEDHELLRKITPEELVDRYTTSAGDLKEDDLGELLQCMAWYTPAHYNYVRRVFKALDSGDRDDVALAMVAKTQDRDLAEMASTKEGQELLGELVPELRGGWESGGEKFAAVRLLRALRARYSAEKAAETELTNLTEAVEKTGAPVNNEPVPVLGPNDLQQRVRLIEVSLDRIAARWPKDSEIIYAINMARSRVPGIRERIATDAIALSSTIPEAQVMLETFETVLPALDAQTQITSIETGTEEADARLVEYVRGRFVRALEATLDPEAGKYFAQAGAAMSGLSSARVAVNVAVLQGRPGLFGAVAIQLKAMNDFAGWVIEQIHWIEKEGAGIVAAERRGENMTVRRRAANQRYDVLSKSLRVLAHWDQSITAAEALESGFSFTEVFYTGIGGTDMGDIHAWLYAMAVAARADDLADLSARLTRFENNPDVKEYYDDIPKILRSSGIVVAIGVALVAAAVTWGIGSFIAAPVAGGAAAGGTAAGGAAAGGATSGITLGGVAAGVGSAAFNALIFTSVHRGLSEAVGIGAHGTFLEDFIWNFALFGALKIIGGATGSFLQARNLMRFAAPAQIGVTFSALELYGMARFAWEAGRLPTGSEFLQMTAQNVIMMAALAGMHAAVTRFSPIGVFQARYGESFAELEAKRLALERDTAEAINKGTLETEKAALQKRGETLKQQFAELVARATKESKADLPAIKAQLQGMSGREVATGLLTETLNMPQEVALHRSGGESQFSYKQGETARVQDGAWALGATEVKVLKVPGRPTVIEATFANRPAMLFVERAAEAPEATTTTVPETLTPQEQNARRLELARDELARRRIQWSQLPENLRVLEKARPRGQSNAKSINQTSSLLTQLEAWIGKRAETPWQKGQEVQVNAGVAPSRAHLSEMPAGELREHLQADDGAVVVYGALRQTSATAAAKMQTLWEAWNAIGREGSFGDFAESVLREEAVTALRAKNETRLADALQADPRVQNAFGRMGYDLARLRGVDLYHQKGYKGDMSLPEYLSKEVGSLRHESRAWGERRANLVVPVPKDGYAPLRTKLAALRTANTMTDADVGIVWRWNRMIQSLIEQSSAKVPGSQAGTRAETVLNYLLEGLGKNFSESSYRTFRVRIRDLIVDDILYVRGKATPATGEAPPVRPWADQATLLEAWEKRFPPGDSGSIGALWTAYVQARFALGLPAAISAIAVVPARSLVLVGGRMGDAVLTIKEPLEGKSAPALGEWAADYKGGSDPFVYEQAENYSKNMNQNQGSFIMGRGVGAHSYKGLIYIFRDARAAEKAAVLMNDGLLNPNLKVGYFGKDGSLIWLR